MTMERVERRELVSLTVGGKGLFGLLHLPLLFSPPYPALFICHGLAGNRSGKHRHYVVLAEALSREGIATLRLDFRGCGDSEGSVREVTVASQLEDAMAALEFLKGRSEIDAGRLALLGRSFGGLIATMAAGRCGGVRTVALWSPVFCGTQWKQRWAQLHAGEGPTPERQSGYIRFEGQVLGYQLFAELFAMDPRCELEKIAGLPLLHLHGEADSIVTIDHAARYREEREKAAKTRFIRLKEGDHSFSRPEDFATALEETVRWLVETLKGEEPEGGSERQLSSQLFTGAER